LSFNFNELRQILDKAVPSVLTSESVFTPISWFFQSNFTVVYYCPSKAGEKNAAVQRVFCPDSVLHRQANTQNMHRPERLESE
jgi:hypothetical protein